MEGQVLKNLEAAAADANKRTFSHYQDMNAANEKAAAAKAVYQQASSDLYNEYDETSMEDKQQAYEEAQQVMKEAQQGAAAAAQAFEESAEVSQAAADAVEAEKEVLRQSRVTDTSYVVHTARVECSCGMRESYLVLGDTHGVYTRQIPQMTVKDFKLDENVINFGGCTSKENPTLIAAAKAAVTKANENIEENKGWRDNVVNFFIKKEEIQVTDSLLEQCMGECIAAFPGDSVWLKGHDKVTINDEAPMLRRCELTCNYGGRIIILLSGQPS